MSRRYPIAQARAQLAVLVDKAAAGDAVEITRKGMVVAVMISVKEYERMPKEQKRPSFLDNYEEFRKKYRLDEEGFDQEYWDNIRALSRGREGKL